MTFIDNVWKLEDDFVVTDFDGTEHDFSSNKFENLPEWAQETIKDYAITIVFFQELTEDQYQEMFYRLNNGKPLSSVELTRVKTQSLIMFQDIAKHPMIDLAVTERGKQKFNHENLAMQAWAACFALDEHDELSFETSTFRPFMEQAVVNELHVKEMKNYFNIAYNMYCSCNLKNKTERKIATKMKTRTHLVALCKTISEGLGSGYEIDHLIEWVKVFFNSSEGVSVDQAYNNASGGNASGTAKRKQIDTRINAMIAHMHKYMEKLECVKSDNAVIKTIKNGKTPNEQKQVA